MSDSSMQHYRDQVVAVAMRQNPYEPLPRIAGESYPYANINLTDEQLRRLPLYVKVAIAFADAEINKLSAR